MYHCLLSAPEPLNNTQSDPLFFFLHPTVIFLNQSTIARILKNERSCSQCGIKAVKLHKTVKKHTITSGPYINSKV